MVKRIKPNAKLTLKPLTAAWEYNPETGNEEAVAGQGSVLIASLITDRGRNRDPEKLQAGTNRNTTFFLGRCVSPAKLPKEITEQTIVDCIITEPLSGRTQVGKLHINEIFSSRHRRVQAALGAKFRGYFIENPSET